MPGQIFTAIPDESLFYADFTRVTGGLVRIKGPEGDTTLMFDPNKSRIDFEEEVMSGDYSWVMGVWPDPDHFGGTTTTQYEFKYDDNGWVIRVEAYEIAEGRILTHAEIDESYEEEDN